MTPREFEAIAQNLDLVRGETKAPDGCFANAVRRYVQGLNWPPTFYVNPAYRAQLRQLLAALQLKQRASTEAVALGVQLLELVSSPFASTRVSWEQAFCGEPGGGGIFPPSAPESPGGERERRAHHFVRRWSAHHLLARGEGVDEASIEAFVASDAYRDALAARIDAFYGDRRPEPRASHDEHEPAFADHRHWALKPTFRIGHLVALAWSESWHFNSVTPKHESRPGEFTWTPRDEATTVRYCESAIIKARYVYATGRDEAALFERLSGLEVFRAEELVALARDEEDVAARRQYIHKMGLSATPRGVLMREGAEPEPDVLAYLADSMGAPEVAIREAAVTAANFLKWDMLQLAMEAIIESDEDIELRQMTARSLREIRRYVEASKAPAPIG